MRTCWKDREFPHELLRMRLKDKEKKISVQTLSVKNEFTEGIIQHCATVKDVSEISECKE